MSDTRANCALALGGGVLLAGGGAIIYQGMQVSELFERVDEHEGDIEHIVNEIKLLKSTVEDTEITAKEIRTLSRRLDKMETNINSIISALQASSIAVESKQPKERHRSKQSKRKERKDENIEDPDKIIRLVRGK